MKLSILLSAPFPIERWEHPAPFATTPALGRLLARGKTSVVPWSGAEAWAYTQLAEATEQRPPVGALSLLGDGGAPGADWWLRADPVHLAVTRDSLVLAPAGHLALERDEADTLAAALNEHFGDRRMSFSALHPQRWYIRMDEPLSLSSGDPEASRGRHLASEPAAPMQGASRALVNEIQMLLHEHPVNERREAAGKPPVNSLWLWGEGRLPALVESRFDTVWSDLPTARGCALASGAIPEPPPARATQVLGRAGSLRQLVTASPTPQGGSVDEAALERDWFAPLLAALRSRKLTELSIVLSHPERATAVESRIASGDLWRFWRRQRPLAIPSP